MTDYLIHLISIELIERKLCWTPFSRHVEFRHFPNRVLILLLRRSNDHQSSWGECVDLWFELVYLSNENSNVFDSDNDASTKALHFEWIFIGVLLIGKPQGSKLFWIEHNSKHSNSLNFKSFSDVEFRGFCIFIIDQNKRIRKVKLNLPKNILAEANLSILLVMKWCRNIRSFQVTFRSSRNYSHKHWKPLIKNLNFSFERK